MDAGVSHLRQNLIDPRKANTMAKKKEKEGF